MALVTFYVWTQRLGYFPRSKDRLEQALENAELTVMAKPKMPIKAPAEILKRIEKGAVLLILDNSASGAHSNDLLNLAGMSVEAADMADYAEISEIPLTPNAAAVIRGKAILRDQKQNVLCAEATIGKGRIIVFSDPALFYNQELGDVSTNLTEKTKLLSELEFQLLKQCLAE